MTKKTTKTRSEAKLLPKPDQKLPFLEHFKELKRRLLFVAVSIGIFGAGAYFIQHQIVELLLEPAEGQKLIYTTPAGGMNFLIQVCLYVGVILSLPVIIYNILKYFEPLMGRQSVRFALFGSVVSALLAVGGMAFGYFAGLPAVLHFLFHQFSPTSEIQPLIAVQSYMGFVTLYMFGASLLFQIPLILIFINRIKRLKPRSLFKGERWFILAAFVLAFIMNPTPNLIEQLMLAGPMILMYQLGIGLIWLINRFDRQYQPLAVVSDSSIATTPPVRRTHTTSVQKRGRRAAKINALLAQDVAIQAERAARLADARQIWQEASLIAEHPIASMVAIADHQPPQIVKATLAPHQSDTNFVKQPVVAAVTVPVHNNRPRGYVDGMVSGRSRAAARGRQFHQL